MKIAFCLHGLIGSIKGKNSDMLGGSDVVLAKSFEHNKANILNDNVDVFIHSWSTELKDQIVDLYKPKKHIIEEQIQFEVPKYIKSSENRAFAHLSRWYSYKKCVELALSYGTNYDLILVQRFDLLWNLPVDFKNLNSNKIYVGKCSLNPNTEWSDRWFIANPQNMGKFATLYDKIYEYMGPGGEFPSSKQYAGISSHFLTRFHSKKLGLQEEFKYNFGGFGSKPNDYNEVRRQYYGDR